MTQICGEWKFREIRGSWSRERNLVPGRVLQRNTQDNGEKGERGAGRREKREWGGERRGEKKEREEGRERGREKEITRNQLTGFQRLTSSWLAGGPLKGHQHPLLQEDQAFCAGQTCT